MIRAAAFLVLVVSASLAPSRLLAQSIEREDETGDFVIQYEANGTPYIARVPATDRIAPDLQLTLQEVGNGWRRYSWTLSNGVAAPATVGRGIRALQVPCLLARPSGQATTIAASGWMLDIADDGTPESTCIFRARPGHAIDPGESVTLVVESAALPGIVTVNAQGVAGFATIPTGEETPDSVRVLVSWAQRLGVRFTAAAPLHDPDELPGPITAVQLMNANLLAMCGTTGWISNQGVCRSLGVKLRNAESAFLEDDIDRAKRMIGAFTSELNAQRGKHVPEPAYQFLAAFLTHLKGRM